MNIKNIIEMSMIYGNKKPTREQIEKYIKYLEGQIDDQYKDKSERLQRYYDCVDDYSVGGICDQVADMVINRNRNAIALLTKQMERDEPFVEDFSRNILCDLNGKRVTSKIVQTKYGQTWIIGSGTDNPVFVSCAKKAETYAKKGYKVMTEIFTVEFYYLCNINKLGIMSQGRILSKRVEDTTDLSYVSTKMPLVLWYAYQDETVNT